MQMHSPLVHIVQVGRASKAGGKGSLHALVALDEAAYIVSEAAIPLAPDVPIWEAAHLIQATAVPGLCNQLRLHMQLKP